MNEYRKIIKWVIICSIPSILLCLISFAFIFYPYFFGGNDNSIEGYLEYEHYSYSFDLYYYVSYSKYYYMGIDDKKYLKDYDKVNDNNMEMIKSLYNDFKNVMIEQEKTYIFDLEEDDIDYDDYYMIYDYCDSDEMDSCTKYREFSLELYDAQTHILYNLQIYKHFRR